MHNLIPKWHARYLRLARVVASWSKDPSTGVGAFIADSRNRPLSFGFNGLPQRIPDNPEWLNNRELKLSVIIHGEKNAAIFAGRSIEGATVYTWPMGPCSNCMSELTQYGIVRVITVAPAGAMAERWNEKLNLSREVARLAGIEWLEYPPDLI